MSGQFPCPHCGNPINEGYTKCGSCRATEEFIPNAFIAWTVVIPVLMAILAVAGFAALFTLEYWASDQINGVFAILLLAAIVFGTVWIFRQIKQRLPGKTVWVSRNIE